MRKFLLLAASAFVVTAAAPAFAEDAAPAATVPATTEASKETSKDASHKGPHRGKSLFERGDTNNDGVVTKEEFLAQSEESFKALDTDGDGKITKAEVEAKRQKMKERYQQRKKQMGDKPVPGGQDAPATTEDKPAEGTSE